MVLLLLYGMVWYIERYGIVLYGLWCGMVWYTVLCFGVLRYSFTTVCHVTVMKIFGMVE